MIPLHLELKQGLDELSIDYSEKQLDQLIALLEQLLKWNNAYNLTAITDPKQALVLHLLDSLAVVPHIKQKNIIDVGCGAGFPGLPLAIMLPEVKFSLLDSNSKKVRFIRQLVHQLDLVNVNPIHARVESHHDKYEAVISRAFASLADMTQLTKHLLSDSGVWLAMKGVYSNEEVKGLPHPIKQANLYQLDVPQLDGERCLVVLTPN